MSRFIHKIETYNLFMCDDIKIHLNTKKISHVKLKLKMKSY